jgi:hypothetical protein
MKKISPFETVMLFVDKQFDMLGKANAVRTVLETYGFEVRLLRWWRDSDIQTWLVSPEHESQLTVLMCHGTGHKEDDPQLISRVSIRKGKYKSGITKWEPGSYPLKPAELPKNTELKSGLLISLACGGGHKMWGEAFLGMGYEYFIGNDSPCNDDGFMFVIAFFNFLRDNFIEQRDREFYVEEAYELARKVDTTGHKEGASSFKLYKRF